MRVEGQVTIFLLIRQGMNSLLVFSLLPADGPGREGVSGGLGQTTQVSGCETLYKVVCSLDVCGLRASRVVQPAPWTVFGSHKNGTQP